MPRSLEVTALTRSKAAQTGVTVGTLLAGELPGIQCDRVQLQQVMLNLIVNAIHREYRAGGRVRRGAGHRPGTEPGGSLASL